MAITKKYGIDVSYHQGVIDWKNVKSAGVEWAIIRGGYGNGNVDTQFVNNITGAIVAGITNIGIYWLSYAYDADSAAVEVTQCLKTIEPYQQYITLPVWFDWEEDSYSYVKQSKGVSLTAAQIQTIGIAWCNGITAAGYSTGIYSNKSNADGWFKRDNQYLWQYLNCEYWYARYGANNEKSLFITPAFERTALAEHPEMNIFQYSDVGIVSGINSQRVNLNIRYVQTSDPPPEPPEPSAPEPEPDERAEAMRNHIDYIEVRNTSFELVGIVDTFNSIIWQSKYYGVGQFEIYIKAEDEILSLLKEDYYITRPNDIEVGIIEHINVSDNEQDGEMLTVSGRFAKSILDRRHICNLSGNSNTATILRGNVETATRQVVSDNAINCAFDSRRNIPQLELGALAGISKKIVDDNGNAAEKQVSYENLLEYTDGVLQEYEMASTVILSGQKLKYTVYEGADRSVGNTAGNEPVIFSKEYDNLLSSEYDYSTVKSKNTALIGGAGEGIERFYSVLESGKSGLARRETWIDASSINRTYKDDSEQEQQYTDAEYIAMLNAKGKQDIAEFSTVETLTGEIDVLNGNYIYSKDFFLGDIVTLQDNKLHKYQNVRIVELTEVQDENGYQIKDIKFE